MAKPFFINILPTNDRREINDYNTLLQKIFSENISEVFKHTLFTVGEQRFDSTVISQFALNIDPLISPIIAVNPFYQSPLLTAKKISTLQYLYPQKDIGLNLVTGSFINKQSNAGDNTDLVERNSRLIDYFKCLTLLTSEHSNVTFLSKYYNIKDYIQYPPLNIEKLPIILSGAFVNELNQYNNVLYLQNYKPPEEMIEAKGNNKGLAIGIFTRPTQAEAFEEFNRIYPYDRKGEMLFQIALNNNETPWNIWLKKYLQNNDILRADYNLKPLLSLKSAAPFIIGSYEEVFIKIQGLIDLGYSFFTVDYEPNEFQHIKNVLKRFI